MGFRQLGLQRRQTAIEEQRHAWEKEQVRLASLPQLVIKPGAIASGHGGSFYDYHADLVNLSETVPARRVTLTAYMGTSPVGASGPFNIDAGQQVATSISISFVESSDELRRRVRFVARDEDEHEWTWEP